MNFIINIIIINHGPSHDARRLSTMMPPHHKKVFDGLFRYDRSWAPHRLSSLVGSFIAYVCSIINQAASRRTPLKRGPRVVNRETSPSLVVRRNNRSERESARRGFTWRVPKACGRTAHPAILRVAPCRAVFFLPVEKRAHAFRGGTTDRTLETISVRSSILFCAPGRLAVGCRNVGSLSDSTISWFRNCSSACRR